MLSSCIVALICQLTTAVSTAFASADGDSIRLLNMPLFRAPSQQEVKSSPHPILWSAHETGDVRKMMPGDSPIRLACLLDGIGINDSMPVRSLVWTLVDEVTGHETRYRMQGSGRDFSFEVGGLPLKGHYSEWIGSTMDVLLPTLPTAQIRVRCEYQPSGVMATMGSSWVILWDERSDVQRFKAASLRCRRTSYSRLGGLSQPPLAVTFSCTGVGDTRLLETAVVSVYAANESVTCSDAASAAARFSVSALSSNSSTSGRDFFGVAFGGSILFGWTVGDFARSNASATPGADFERKLEVPGTNLCLMLFTYLPSGRALLLSYLVVEYSTRKSVTISHEEPLLLPAMDKEGPAVVQLDELMDPPIRALPCPLLCLPGQADTCKHRWIGPGHAAPTRDSPASQPLSLPLRFSDRLSVGMWICGVGIRASASIVYAVTARPRPRVCGPRLPRRIVVFPPDRLSINCSLCGLTVNANIEFDVFASGGAATYSVKRTDKRWKNGSASLGLSLSEFLPSSGGATIILRCRSVEQKGGRTSADFTTIHLLPVPVMKSLSVCQSGSKPCRADCRSSLVPRLRHLGVSVTYLFSVYSTSGYLHRIVLDNSGVLENVRKVAGEKVEGDLRPECKQLFYYSDGRDGLSATETFALHSERTKDLYRMELGENRYNRLILVLSEKNNPNQDSENSKREITRRSSLSAGFSTIYVLLVLAVFAALAVCMATCIRLIKEKKHPAVVNKLGSVAQSARQSNNTQTPQMGISAIGPLNQAAQQSQVRQQPVLKQHSQEPNRHQPWEQGFQKSEKQQQQQQPQMMRLQYYQAPQQPSDESINYNAVRRGLEADLEATSPSTRSIEVSAAEDFLSEAQNDQDAGQIPIRSDSVSTDSEAVGASDLQEFKNARLQSINTEAEDTEGQRQFRLSNQHSSSADDVRGCRQSRLSNQHSSFDDDLGKCRQSRLSRGRSSSCRVASKANPAVEDCAPTQISRGNSAASVAAPLVGFDFCFNEDSE